MWHSHAHAHAHIDAHIHAHAHGRHPNAHVGGEATGRRQCQVTNTRQIKLTDASWHKVFHVMLGDACGSADGCVALKGRGGGASNSTATMGHMTATWQGAVLCQCVSRAKEHGLMLAKTTARLNTSSDS